MKVLLGIGGSDDSVRALEQTVSRTAVAGDDLTIAIVDNPSSDRSKDELEETARRLLEAEGIEAEIRRLDGDPGSRIVGVAEEEGFEKIVLGGGKRSPMGKINIGGIAEFVLLNSRVTVSLVR